jgi:hypothetical protein
MPTMNSEYKTNFSNRMGKQLLIATICVLAILMTLKYFPGLENEPAYAGVAFQTIHPDAFQGDPYRNPDLKMSSRIIQLSAVYGLVKLVGDIWLDDRFLALVYLGLVIIGLIGIDKTAQLFGLKGTFERLAVLLVFAKDHAVLDHKVLLAHHQDFNHTAFAIPIIVWLFYAALSRKGLPIVLILSALLLATSIRNAPLPILMAIAVVFFTGTKFERLSIGALSIIGFGASYFVLFHLMAVSDSDRLVLWDVLREAGEGDVNPFHEAFYQFGFFLRVNALWLAVIAAAFFLFPKRHAAALGVRVLMAAGFFTWLIGGTYISFAPDALKFPLLQGIAPTRALAWPQNIAYIALFASGFTYLATSTTARRRLIVMIGFIALFVLGPGNIEKWALLTIASAAIACLVHAWGKPIFLTGRNSAQSFSEHAARHTPKIIVQTLVLVLSVSYGNSLHHKLPAWQSALNFGVFGDSLPATWIGIAEHFQNNTPDDTVVLPISYSQAGNFSAPATRPDEKIKITINRSLGTRSGRAMPVPEDFPGNFRESAAWEKSANQKALITNIKQALLDQDHCAVFRTTTLLEPVPDYIVLPKDMLNLNELYIGAYIMTKTMRGYAFLKHSSEARNTCLTQ